MAIQLLPAPFTLETGSVSSPKLSCGNVAATYDNATIGNTTENSAQGMKTGAYTRIAQKYTPGADIKSVGYLSFKLSKTGVPTGDVNFVIRKVSDDSVIATVTSFNASILTVTDTVYKVAFATPVDLNNGESYYISCEFSGGSAGNTVDINCNTTSVYADDLYRYNAGWAIQGGVDLYFVISYGEKWTFS